MKDTDLRMAPLAPHESDGAGDAFVSAGATERARAKRRQLLQNLAPLLAKVPRWSRPQRIGQRGIPVRLGAIAWSSITPELCGQVRDQVVHSTPTLKRGGELLWALRGTLKLALQHEPARLFLCLQALRVEGVSAERAESMFWYDYPDDDAEVESHAADCDDTLNTSCATSVSA